MKYNCYIHCSIPDMDGNISHANLSHHYILHLNRQDTVTCNKEKTTSHGVAYCWKNANFARDWFATVLYKARQYLCMMQTQYVVIIMLIK